MAFIADTVFDTGLGVLTTNLDRIDITSQEALNYTEATSTYTLGNAATTTGAVTNGDTDGRKVIIAAISGATVGSSGTASHFAGTDGTSVLYVTNSLSSSQAVTASNTWDLTAIDVTLRDAA